MVSDPDGATATATVAVTVLTVNDPPKAGDDAVTTEEDRSATFDVLANDTDPYGDVLRVERVSSAEHGTTRVAPGGGVEYRPAPDYHGPDRFTYVVSDPDGATSSATVVVTVCRSNDAPVAVGVIPEQPLDEGGGSLDVDVTPYFDDPEGDALIYRAVSSDQDVATVRVAGAVLTLTPVVYGSALVTVTVVRAVLHDTLAAMARSHMASARMTLGRRVVAGGGRRSRLTVLDRSVPLGTAGRGRRPSGWRWAGCRVCCGRARPRTALAGHRSGRRALRRGSGRIRPGASACRRRIRRAASPARQVDSAHRPADSAARSWEVPRRSA